MKIISRFKDYYDYMSGIIGVDTTRILDRGYSTGQILHYARPYRLRLYIADYIMDGYYVLGQVYFGEAVNQIGVVYDKNNKAHQLPYQGNAFQVDSPTHVIFENDNWNRKQSTLHINNKLRPDPNKTNSEYGVAILLGRDPLDNPPGHAPRLADFKGIVEILPPQKIWLMLNDWLGYQITKNEKQVPIGDDKVRIVSHGFDLKTSFRNVK